MKKVETIERECVYTLQCRTCRHHHCKDIDCTHCICLYEVGEKMGDLKCHCFDLVPANIKETMPNCGFYIKE